MKKHRINTTISQEHYKLLKKHVEKHGTQQKVLEIAIEGLETVQNSIIHCPLKKKFGCG